MTGTSAVLRGKLCLFTRSSTAGRRPRRCDGLQGWDTTGRRCRRTGRRMEATESARRAGPRPLFGVSQGSPQAATPTRLFPRFRRLKRSSAAAHNAHGWTARDAVPTRFGEEMGAGWGLLAWIGRFVKVALQLRAKPRGLSRMIRCCCCVACLVCLVGQKVGICVLLTDRYRMLQGGFWGRKGCGWVWEPRGLHRGLSVSEKSMWAPQVCMLPRVQVGWRGWRGGAIAAGGGLRTGFMADHGLGKQKIQPGT